jgi:hypothetical protein
MSIRQTLFSEWRKQRWLLYAAAAIVVLCELGLRMGWITPNKTSISDPFFYYSFMWFGLVAGSAAGALVFAGGPNHSVGAEAQGFSLPIPFLKLSIGISVAFLSSIIANFAVPALFSDWPFDRHSSLSWLLTLFNLVPLKSMAGLLLAFASSILLSIMSRRALTSAVASLALTSFLFFSASELWRRLDLPPEEHPIGLVASISVAAAILLGIFFYAALRCKHSIPSMRSLLTGAIIISLVTILVTGSLVFIHLRVETKDMQLESWVYDVSPTGQNILKVATHDSEQIQISIVPVDPKQGKRVVLRNAYGAKFSQDGKWIVYLSPQNRLGLVSDFISLYACRIDGSDDQAIIPDFAKALETKTELDGCFGINVAFGVAVAPDDTRVAMNFGSDLYIAGLDGHSVHKVQLSSEFSSRDPSIIGFHSNGTEVLLRSSNSNNGIIACNPMEGKCRVLLSGNSDVMCFPRHIGGIRRILFLRHFFDVESATMRSLPFDVPKYYQVHLEMSRDQQTIAYAINDPEKFMTQIHIYVIESGADDLVAIIPGWAEELHFSPSGNSIAMNLTVGEVAQVAIVQSKKLIQSFTGWVVHGWASETEVIISQDNKQRRTGLMMAVGDIVTGNIRQFYP